MCTFPHTSNSSLLISVMAKKDDTWTYPQPKEVVELNWWNASEERVKHANKIWSGTYDQDTATSGYVASKLCAEAFNDLTPAQFPGLSDKTKLRILDIGCGTGQVGQRLHELGFHNIDALDATEEMLEKCKAKGVYKNYICAYLTDKPVDIESAVYDGLVSAAAVTPGQIRPVAFDEILRWMKPGGIMCFTCRKDAYESEEYGFRAKFEELEQSKRWQLISNTLTDYYVHTEAEQFSHSKCHMLVYKVSGK